MPKQFKVEKLGSNEDVLGGPVTEDNAYIAIYPSPLPGKKHPTKLDIGESTVCTYNLSPGQRGGKGTDYRVVRIA